MPEDNAQAQAISTEATLVRQTKDEKTTVKQQAQKEGTEEVNIWRRAMREYLEKRGAELPKELFTDRGPGNRLPKPKGKEERPAA